MNLDDFSHWEHDYLFLMRRVMQSGEQRNNRTGVDTVGLFAPGTIDISLELGFPMVTTKLVRWKPVVEELLWFLRGEVTITSLQERGVHFWDAWADEETGYVGPMYGYQWRHWRWAPTGRLYDQLAEALRQIREEPESRRIIVSAWNVAALDDMALPPCHLLYQFRVSKRGRLDCQVYIRSWDLLIGAPFNIASYALLTSLMAHCAGLKPGRLIICPGDAHVYVNHYEQVKVQLRRKVFRSPRLVLDPEIREIADFTECWQAQLNDYQYWPALEAPVAV